MGWGARLNSMKLRFKLLAAPSLLIGSLLHQDALGLTETQPTTIEPQLVARSYKVRVLRPSSSGKVYLLEKTDASAVLPTEGKILLIKDGTESPLMALRVVKQYPDKGSFAAKRIKRYGETRRLNRRAILASLEKAGDFFPQLPTTPEQTQELDRDLKELESKDAGLPLEADLAPPPPPVDGDLSVNPDTLEEELPNTVAFDPELDKTTTPVPNGAAESLDANREVSALAKDLRVNEDGTEYELEASSATAEDMVQFDWLGSSLGAQLGLFKNNTAEGTSVYFTGAGVRYGTTLSRYLLLRSTHLQDSLSVDTALSIYKILNFIDADAYTVAPVTLTARYNIHFSSNLYVFFYGGFNRAFVTSAVSPTDEGLAALTSFLPSAGAGLSISVGPRWEFRGDIGIDVISGGLVLRF